MNPQSRQSGIGPPCAECGHGEGHHQFGYVKGRIEWETPCQRRDCDCPAFAPMEEVGDDAR